MDRSKVDELTERVRDSKFTKDIVGPKVARPLAAWLDRTFADEGDALAADAGSHKGDADPRSNGVTVASPNGHRDVAPAVEADEPAAEPTSGATAEVDESASESNGTVEAGPLGFLAALKAIPAKIKEHNLVVVAAGIAFWGLLAIPAILFATVSIAGLVLNPDTVTEQVEENLTGLPEDARSIVADQLQNVSSGSTGGLITGLVLGLLLALWSSSGAMAKLMATLNTINGVAEGRSFPKLRGLALALTFGGITFVSASVFLLAVMPALLRNIEAVGDAAADLFNWLRFPALGLVMVIALGVLYHFGPDVKGRKYRLVTFGALVATVLWVALSGLFSIYTSTVASYNETYGSLGGLVVLLLWLFISAFVVLIGAEIHALMARQSAGSEEPTPV